MWPAATNHKKTPVEETKPMKPLWVNKSCLAALLFALLAATAGTCCAAPAPPPPMTIKIFNNSCTLAAGPAKCKSGEAPYNIYPVISMGEGPVDQWLQAAFLVTAADLPNKPYPRAHVFRLYFNPEGDGIPPGGSITVSLPFYTQLAATVNPKTADQQGNRVKNCVTKG
jgi:hypothetical protein